MKTMKLEGGDVLIVLETGDELHPSVIQACQEYGIEGGSLTAIGAVDELELGYFVPHDRTYLRRVIEEDMEVVGVTGNVAMRDGKPFLHAHGVFSGRDFAAVAGHVFRARASVTLEVFLHAAGRLTRRDYPEFGLTRLL